jgi:hypothetical protein
MFDTGLLSSLTFEQMSHIKSLSEHQAFVHSWNCLIEDSLTGDTASSYNMFVAALDKYNYEIDKLLPMLFNKETTQHYLLNKKRLKVLNTIHKGMEIVNTALDFIPIHDSISDGIDIAEKLFGKYISNKQINHDYWVREQTASSSEFINEKKSHEKLLLPRGVSSQTNPW